MRGRGGRAEGGAESTLVSVCSPVLFLVPNTNQVEVQHHRSVGLFMLRRGVPSHRHRAADCSVDEILFFSVVGTMIFIVVIIVDGNASGERRCRAERVHGVGSKMVI
jgi:hypothetical protein